jgi:hypothetical protein
LPWIFTNFTLNQKSKTNFYTQSIFNTSIQWVIYNTIFAYKLNQKIKEKKGEEKTTVPKFHSNQTITTTSNNTSKQLQKNHHHPPLNTIHTTIFHSQGEQEFSSRERKNKTSLSSTSINTKPLFSIKPLFNPKKKRANSKLKNKETEQDRQGEEEQKQKKRGEGHHRRRFRPDPSPSPPPSSRRR